MSVLVAVDNNLKLTKLSIFTLFFTNLVRLMYIYSLYKPGFRMSRFKVIYTYITSSSDKLI